MSGKRFARARSTEQEPTGREGGRPLDEREASLVLLEAGYRHGVDSSALFERFGSAAAALGAAAEEQMAVEGIGPAGALALAALGRELEPRRLLRDMRVRGAQFVARLESDFPAPLAAISGAPAGLWTRGEPGALAGKCIAVVGARRATAYGLRLARELGGELAAAGVTVVSGLARGIDSAAHEGALDAGGRTVAVLGCGIDVCYPPENVTLARRIAASGGCLVTEFPPGAPPAKHHFPRRNRILSGLCLGVVVVEATLVSGSLITARLALDQGRDVFAVPGDVDRPLSAGPNLLLHQGAAVARSAADVLEHYGLEPIAPRAEPMALAADETALLELLESRGTHADWLAERAPGVLLEPNGRTWQAVLAGLLIKGAVRRLPGNRYARIPRVQEGRP
ncbi:MAG: DNA-protecting protein DprA [Candidatus Wallbacteria bacterium]|nr:DNA-protecting protein DprA [Candidatus Wallbacteria bacterium]